MRHFLSVALIACASTLVRAGDTLQINELMQSNIDCIMDDLNDFPDSWVELYNPSSSPVDLGEYSVCDTNNPAGAFALPSLTVQPGGFVLVYCDKVGEGMHADFRLESGKGGCVYLFRNGVVADRVEGMKKMPAPNIAYGRLSQGDSSWGYQYTPTPGAANCGVLCGDILPAPVFSREGGVCSGAFRLELSLPDGAPAGAVIRYTTDGSEPVSSSARYSSPVSISATTVVRAKVFADGWLSPRSSTHSYIFFPRKVTLPIVCMSTDRDYFYGADHGIYVEGRDKDDPNYGHDWRRPVNVEIFYDPEEGSVVNQLCETRVKGGASRSMGLKSLVVYANKRFGEKRLNHEFFPEQAPGLTEWKSIELRNSGNDFDYLYFRDALIQRSVGEHADMDWQPWQPAIFMLNGSYMGMLNIRSRSTEDYVYTFYDGLEDIDMFENLWELKSGDWDNYNAFRDFYAGTGHTLDEYAEWMDVDEFTSYMVMQLFYDNKDFPGNNIVMWRPRSDGGKWRWIAKDTDFGLGLYDARYDFKTFNWFYDNGYDPGHAWANTADATRLFRRLMDIPDYRNLFIDRACVFLGDFLREDSILALLDGMYGQIRSEYPSHRALFNPWWPDYNSELAKARSWIARRIPFFIDHMADYYGLGDAASLRIDAGRTDAVSLYVNGIALSSRDFDGRFHQGRCLTVRGVCDNPDMAVTGWEVAVGSGSSREVYTVDGDVLSLDVPRTDALEVSSIVGAAGICDVTADRRGFDVEAAVLVFDCAGRSLGSFGSLSEARSSLPRGVYVLRQGAVSKVMAF